MSEPLPLAAAAVRLRGKPGRPPLSDEEKARRRCQRQAALALIHTRLFDVPSAARYLGLSPWTIRDLIANGALPRVTIGDMRRILIDRHDCDQLIESSKAPA
jgi:excisionase family DNA binding protein